MIQKIKKHLKLYIAMIINLLIISLYITLFFCNLTAIGKLTLDPVELIRGIKIYGFPVRGMIINFCVLIMFFIYILRRNKDMCEEDRRNFKYSNSGVYGTAALLKEEELEGYAKIENTERANGTILGQIDKSGSKIINTDMNSRTNKHVAVFGASGSGKSRCYAIPFILQAVKRRESVIVTDPKGELYESTAQYLMDNGYIVKIFDLVHPEKSDGWNCLKELRGEEIRAQIFSNVVIENTGIGKGDVWDNSAMSLLKALILRVERGHDFKKMGKQSIGDAYEMIQNPMGEIFLDSMFNPNSLKRDEQVCIGPYMTFKQGSDNMRGNIISGLATRMQVFQNEVIRKITAVDDIDLTLPAIKPCAYFCIMSDQHTTLNFLSTLFFTYAFMDQVEYADMNGGKCPVPINYLLEEFPNIGIIPDCEKKVATVRSRDINISIIFQDIMQMKNRYPYSWSSILGNCDTHLFLGCNDEDTAQYISNRSGETTVKVSTVQHAKVESMFTVGHNHSSGDGRRKIFTPDEIRTFPLDKALIMFRGKHIMEAHKYDFSLHPESKKFNRIYIQNRPSIDDNIGRAEYKAKMNLYMQNYIDSVAFKTDLEKDIKSNDYVKVAKADIDLQDIDYAEYEDDDICVINDDLLFMDMEYMNKEGMENDETETIDGKDIPNTNIINNIPDDNTIKKNTVEPPATQRVFKYRAN